MTRTSVAQQTMKSIKDMKTRRKLIERIAMDRATNSAKTAMPQ
jgi:hypothetical protein